MSTDEDALKRFGWSLDDLASMKIVDPKEAAQQAEATDKNTNGKGSADNGNQ